MKNNYIYPNKRDFTHPCVLQYFNNPEDTQPKEAWNVPNAIIGNWKMKQMMRSTHTKGVFKIVNI